MKRIGRKPRIKDIEKAQKMIKNKCTFRETSWAILKREDTKTIHRWLKINVGKLKKELSTP